MAITMIWDFDSDTPLSIRDNIMRVDWYNAGEGLCGDYDPDDPQDINLLRFDVYVLGEKETEHGSDDGWKEVEDASYCTNVPANSAHEILEESLKYIFSEYRGVIDQYPHNSFRRLGERLSWISDLDFMSEPQRSIMKEFMTKMIPVEPKEYFPFHCQQCGACCRHVKESVPLESLDAFRLAKYLRDRGEAIQCMDDVLAKYAVPVLLHESGYMVFMLGTVGPDDACIFLRDNKCTIHAAKPKACRTYPVSVGPAERGGYEAYLSMEQPHHFNGPQQSVKKWVQKRCSRQDYDFWKTDVGSAQEIARHLEKLSLEQKKGALLQFLRYKYSEFDLDKPFTEQFTENNQKLLVALRNQAQKGDKE